jgi:hypothetical protein
LEGKQDLRNLGNYPQKILNKAKDYLESGKGSGEEILTQLKSLYGAAAYLNKMDAGIGAIYEDLVGTQKNWFTTGVIYNPKATARWIDLGRGSALDAQAEEADAMITGKGMLQQYIVDLASGNPGKIRAAAAGISGVGEAFEALDHEANYYLSKFQTADKIVQFGELTAITAGVGGAINIARGAAFAAATAVNAAGATVATEGAVWAGATLKTAAVWGGVMTGISSLLSEADQGSSIMPGPARLHLTQLQKILQV